MQAKNLFSVGGFRVNKKPGWPPSKGLCRKVCTLPDDGSKEPKQMFLNGVFFFILEVNNSIFYFLA